MGYDLKRVNLLRRRPATIATEQHPGGGGAGGGGNGLNGCLGNMFFFLRGQIRET